MRVLHLCSWLKPCVDTLLPCVCISTTGLLKTRSLQTHGFAWDASTEKKIAALRAATASKIRKSKFLHDLPFFSGTQDANSEALEIECLDKDKIKWYNEKHIRALSIATGVNIITVDSQGLR
jgi:hypothetical protein